MNMDIKLGDAVSKTIDNVAINAINNTNRYNVQTKDDQIAGQRYRIWNTGECG